jgi:hypothetical protein
MSPITHPPPSRCHHHSPFTGKAHLGWEYGATHTTIRVFTSSKRYTKETEDILNYHIHHFLGVR